MQVLRPIQAMFPAADHPDLMIGLGVPDDAAVYRLDSEQALIVTTDFFTPIVDDAYEYGAIAAANALSDVYAMGGRPILALNIAAFPDNLPIELLGDILRGSAEKVREANAVIAGGHTIKDQEPKIGLAVVGLAHPDRILTKDDAQPGDVLVLTKPLGTGTITTAGKNDKVKPEHLAEAVRWMSTLNRAGGEAAVAAGASAATDITGFGLLGHAIEMAEASDVTFKINAAAVPLMPGAAEYADQWIFPGGSTDNMRTYQDRIAVQPEVSKELAMLLYDAQTSGGLLIAVPVGQLASFGEHMQSTAADWWQVGEVVTYSEKRIIVSQ